MGQSWCTRNRFFENQVNTQQIIYHSIENEKLSNFCEDTPWLPMMASKLPPKNRKNRWLFKICLLFHFFGYKFLTIIDNHGVSSQKLLSFSCSIEWCIICRVFVDFRKIDFNHKFPKMHFSTSTHFYAKWHISLSSLRAPLLECVKICFTIWVLQAYWSKMSKNDPFLTAFVSKIFYFNVLLRNSWIFLLISSSSIDWYLFRPVSMHPDDFEFSSTTFATA